MSAQSGVPEPLAVVKVGGSLLDFPELPRRLEELLRALWAGGMRPVLIAGGGPAADLARGWDAAFDLGEERAHRLALSAMGLNARLLAEVIHGARLVADRTGLASAWDGGRIPVLDTAPFLEEEEARAAASPLPHRWSATSDSVAGWIALRLEAAELVLVKSAPPPPQATLWDLAAQGYVDRDLPEMAAPIKAVSVVDLRGGREGGAISRRVIPNARRR